MKNRRLLEEHPNLFLGFKIEDRFEQVGSQEPMPSRMVDKNMKIKPEWHQFFTDYPHRFLVASDEFIGIPGRTMRSPQSFEETWAFQEQLPDEVAKKVGKENAAKLY